MTRIFFVIFIACEAAILLIYILFVWIKCRKFHYLSTMEQIGPYAISNYQKNKPFKVVVYSLSKKKYVEYEVQIDKDRKVVYKATGSPIDEKLSAARFFHVGLGSFVRSNLDRPFFNPTLNYLYGRSYLLDGDDPLLNENHDDSNQDIERLFITYSQVNGHNKYRYDHDTRKLMRVYTSVFPKNPKKDQTAEWTIERYYEYMISDKLNHEIPDTTDMDTSARNPMIYFQYDDEHKNWRLRMCPPGDLFNSESGTCELDINEIFLPIRNQRSKVIRVNNLFKPALVSINKNSNLMDLPDNIRKRVQTKHGLLTIHHDEDETIHRMPVHSGYNSINPNFYLEIEGNDCELKRFELYELKEQSAAHPEYYIHLDQHPSQYIHDGRLIDAYTPIIVHDDKIYFSNPVLFEIINNIRREYAGSEIISGMDTFPKLHFLTFKDPNISIEFNLIHDIVAVIGIYGENVVANMLISREYFSKVLEENKTLPKFQDFFERKTMSHCNHDFTGSFDFQLIDQIEIDKVRERYIDLCVFDLYDNFNHNELLTVEI